jgi:hypothetical protein
MRYTYDPILALHEAHRMIATGDNHIRPLEVVAEVNPGWENSVLTQLALLRFHEDIGALPPGVQFPKGNDAE